MVKKDIFWGIYNYERNSNDYNEHMARLQDKQYERPAFERKLDIIFETYRFESDKKIATQKFNSCLRSFPIEKEKFRQVLNSMPINEVKTFCNLESQKRASIIKKYI